VLDEHRLRLRRPPFARRVGTYGLGTSNQNLPGFVVIKDSEATVVNGVRNWGNGFMPAVYQGVEFTSDGTPIKYLDNPKGVDRQRQRDKLDLLGALNREYGASRASNTELDARIKGYELAYQMQAEAPEAVDLSKETEATKKLYGMDDEEDGRLWPQLPPRPPSRRKRRPLHSALQRCRQQVGQPQRH
jgi:hypothetical protein